jgi:hypothetical protein
MEDYLEQDLLGDGSALLYLRDGFLGAQETLFDSSWSAFKYRVQHVTRFFDGTLLGAPRVSLLQRVQRQLARLEVILPAGTTLFRARVAPCNEFLPPEHDGCAREVGPAPARKSRGNRMSPPGISYTYLSFDTQTALEEVRRGDADGYWVGQFVTRRPLTIVDLSFTPGRASQSIFDPKYDHQFRLLAPSLRELSCAGCAFRRL